MRALVLAFVALFSSLVAAHAEKRVALVVGNSAYTTISPLANPKNDAELMARTLEEVGFEVVTAIEVDRRAMGRAVRDFGKKLRAAGKDAVGLFYFAGHGVQAQGANYLIPLGAQIETEADLDLEALSASDILRQMEDAGNALNLIILDACRNNPFKVAMRSGGRGLARVQAASGTLVAFAAAPGQVAADGREENSPYTRALVEAIRTPGLPVEQVFKHVRVSVEGQTGGTQTPWEESSLRGNFYFIPPKAEPIVTAPVIAAPSVPSPRAAASEAGTEALFWNSVKDTNNPVLLQTYIDQYPTGVFSGLAKAMIAQIGLAREQAERTRAAAETEQQTAAALAPAAPATEASATPEGKVALGLKYETGDGVAKDPGEAARWYREAASSGSSEAKYRLGLLYYRGEGVGRSFTEAAIQILDAVKANHRPAVTALSEATTLSEPEFLKMVQQRLGALGYYRSAVDGRWGSGSRSAVAALATGKLPAQPDKSDAKNSGEPDAKKKAAENARSKKSRPDPVEYSRVIWPRGLLGATGTINSQNTEYGRLTCLVSGSGLSKNSCWWSN